MIRRQTYELSFGDRTLSLGDRTIIMGVLNVTPDSFSDGGRFLSVQDALRRSEEMLREGADVIDVGGESTRPGSVQVQPDEEIRRVAPVIERIRAEFPDAIVSVDTTKAEVAARAIDAGAGLINDISALRFDPEMGRLAARSGLPVILMHMQGTPKTMQAAPSYGDAVGEVRSFLDGRIQEVTRAGVARERVLVDPGIGFGKTLKHNLQLLAGLSTLADLGCPVVVGTSRKSFIGRLLDDAPVGDRLEGTLASAAIAIANGAHMLRVHDIKESVRTARVVDAIARCQR